MTLLDILELPVEEAAPRLLGATIASDVGGRTSLRITEVEAYAGELDEASHAHRGPTPRTLAMFGPPGTLYVYRSYGIHWCANVVVAPVGRARAVLLRAGVPIEGEPRMRDRRGPDRPIAAGPGMLCQALGITGALDGSSVLDGPVRVEPPASPVPYVATPRIGISKAVDTPWRFVVTD